MLTKIPSKVGKALVRKYKRRNYRRKVSMPRAPTGSFLSRQETFSVIGVAGQVYDLNNLSLADLPVCAALAKYYQYYRITSVQMRFKPNFDTFAQPSVNIVPYLYFLYDKSGSLGQLTAPQFEEAGAKPQRFDDKTVLRKWKPSVITGLLADSITQFKTSPWLPTHDLTGENLNDVYHLGAVWYVSKMAVADAEQYDIDITVTVQMRKPLVEPPGQNVQRVNLLQVRRDQLAQGIKIHDVISAQEHQNNTIST